MTAIIRRDWSKREIIEQREHTGYRPGRVVGGYISDLVALKKAIILCGSCSRKFNRVKNGYVIPINTPLVNGRCDGCKQIDSRNTLYLHHEQLPR